MNSKLLEVAKKARQLNRVPSAIVNKRREEEQKKKNEEFRKRQQEFFRKQFAGLQNIGAQDPAASGTPINIVQKPNGKLAAEVSNPVPLGGRKPKPFNPKKLREYINKIKK